MGTSYQKGWVMLRGKKWYGYFRRTVIDPKTNEPKPAITPIHPWIEGRDVEIAGQSKTGSRDRQAGKAISQR